MEAGWLVLYKKVSAIGLDSHYVGERGHMVIKLVVDGFFRHRKLPWQRFGGGAYCNENGPRGPQPVTMLCGMVFPVLFCRNPG